MGHGILRYKDSRRYGRLDTSPPFALFIRSAFRNVAVYIFLGSSILKMAGYPSEYHAMCMAPLIHPIPLPEDDSITAVPPRNQSHASANYSPYNAQQCMAPMIHPIPLPAHVNCSYRCQSYIDGTPYRSFRQTPHYDISE